MAAPTLNTSISRRTMLAGGAAVLAAPAMALPGIAAFAALPGAAPPDPDARLTALARQYRQATADLTGWIAAVERRHGPGAYDARPELRRPYAALLAREDRALAALAAARPDSVRGLAIKLRAAFYCDDLRDAEPDHIPTLLSPALGDLERLAE